MNYLCPTGVLIKSCNIKILACQDPFAFHLEYNTNGSFRDQGAYLITLNSIIFEICVKNIYIFVYLIMADDPQPSANVQSVQVNNLKIESSMY